MSALDKVLDFSIDNWTDAQRASNSKEAKLLREAENELTTLRARLAAAEDELRFFRNAFPNAARNWQAALLTRTAAEEER